jgi:hypothetical protein
MASIILTACTSAGAAIDGDLSMTTTSDVVTAPAPVNDTPSGTVNSSGQAGATTSQPDVTDDTSPTVDAGVSDTEFVPLNLVVGTCFDDPPDDVELVTPGDVPIVDCGALHDNEVFGNFDLADEEFPGSDAVQIRANDLCHGAFEGYVGTAYESSQYDFSWYFPTAESWQVGGTNIICFVYNTDLSSITGSVQGTQN